MMEKHDTDTNINTDTGTQDTAATANSADVVQRCLFCGKPEQLIWVHGHGQCAHCGVNAMPCCDGAACEM